MFLKYKVTERDLEGTSRYLFLRQDHTCLPKPDLPNTWAFMLKILQEKITTPLSKTGHIPVPMEPAIHIPPAHPHLPKDLHWCKLQPIPW